MRPQPAGVAGGGGACPLRGGAADEGALLALGGELDLTLLHDELVPSFTDAVLRDVRRAFRSAGGAAMVPQRPFLIAGTIRDNVLLGRALVDAAPPPGPRRGSFFSRVH